MLDLLLLPLQGAHPFLERLELHDECLVLLDRSQVHRAELRQAPFYLTKAGLKRVRSPGDRALGRLFHLAQGGELPPELGRLALVAGKQGPLSLQREVRPLAPLPELKELGLGGGTGRLGLSLCLGALVQARLRGAKLGREPFYIPAGALKFGFESRQPRHLP